MLCWSTGGYGHVVPDEIAQGVFGLGIGIVGGCGACGGMLIFRSCGPRHPGLGLKLGFSAGTATDFIIGEG